MQLPPLPKPRTKTSADSPHREAPPEAKARLQGEVERRVRRARHARAARLRALGIWLCAKIVPSC
ncbi:MAG: hypothetical protein EAZ11_12970 [Curvibacter sp.]|nr:MAG: hypothetical protein EAZ11_12970 [Curvibacter sp.]